jgi:energy-converting hydrogenase Eha subunit G
MAVVSRFVFALLGFLMMMLAIGLMGYGLLGSFYDPEQWLSTVLLDAVGYVIISVAVFEVAKYILEEEVIREREMRHVSEARKSLTKFISTITIVVFLEAIVVIFKVGRDDPTKLLFPTLLLFAGVAMILGLGAFQRLSATTEREVGRRDDATEGRSALE